MANLYPNLPKPGTYVVTRGDVHDDTYTEEFSNALLDPTKEAILLIAQDIKRNGQNNYGGAYYQLRFRADQPITVDGLSFFGPITEEKASYDVDLQVFKPIKKQIFPETTKRNLRIDELRRVKGVQKGQTFEITFTRPLQVTPTVWYLIQFKLEGPDTVRCRSTDLTKTVETEKGPVNFQFTEGTRQLPQIHFSF